MKKPDNVVFNTKKQEYDAYKRQHPTSFNSKKFTPEIIKNLKNESKPYFQAKFNEIINQYEILIEELKWNELIFNSSYNFNPIIGKEYYLYEKKKKIFLSIITPEEWNLKCIGKFKLQSNNTWKKV